MHSFKTRASNGKHDLCATALWVEFRLLLCDSFSRLQQYFSTVVALLLVDRVMLTLDEQVHIVHTTHGTQEVRIHRHAIYFMACN